MFVQNAVINLNIKKSCKALPLISGDNEWVSRTILKE